MTLRFETSGSTGRPKTFLVNDDSFAKRVNRTASTKGDDFSRLQSLYVDFISTSMARLRYKTFATQNGTAFYTPLESRAETLRTLRDNNVEGIVAGPDALLEFARLQSGYRFKHLVSTGDFLLPAISREIRKELGDNLWVSYGASEGGTIAVGRAVETAEIEIGCVGYPCKDIECQVVDNRVRVRGETFISSYEAGPNENFQHGWFYPGDRGYFNKKGMLVLTGRAE